MPSPELTEPLFIRTAIRLLEEVRFEYTVLPLKESIDRYVAEGIPCGDFLTAVLAGDYRTALDHADGTNRWLLPVYCAYLYNEVPSYLHGSYEKVAQHVALKRVERAMAPAPMIFT